ncbi:MAG: imidazolonepropionase [Candidatus Cloacimonetes bacterium]|nr:imidazolonepropionase [Candidatus Cloacimonadota bacterium]MCK9185284.1 imidazolonepropionase [Candidatus Cloacimonadota bacterium]
MKADTIIINIGQVATMASGGKSKSGAQMNDAGILSDAGIAIRDGLILEIGPSAEIEKKYHWDEAIDAKGRILTPGFVDSHTHPVFVHTREDEFAMRLAGKSYVEISLAGGGIRSSIASTRAASVAELVELSLPRIQRMIALGTTTLEAKSGYGLSVESELKQLKAIDELSKVLPIDIVCTFLGAHEYPIEYENDHVSYLKILTQEMIPAVKEQGIAEFCDIFTEAHVFSIEESRKVLRAAKDQGLKLKMHADEIIPIGGAELAAEMGCTSADHLGAASDNGIMALKAAGVIPTLLPATLFSLAAKTYARGRFMIDSGLPVAIATDYNPGSCNCDSMPFTMSLACLQMGLTPIEALSAATINAACALGRLDQVGSLEPGKLADIIIWDIPSLNFIPYHLGSSHIVKVLKRGRRIFKA